MQTFWKHFKSVTNKNKFQRNYQTIPKFDPPKFNSIRVFIPNKLGYFHQKVLVNWHSLSLLGKDQNLSHDSTKCIWIRDAWIGNSVITIDHPLYLLFLTLKSKLLFYQYFWDSVSSPTGLQNDKFCTRMIIYLKTFQAVKVSDSLYAGAKMLSYK